jgi:hypothetical protein
MRSGGFGLICGFSPADTNSTRPNSTARSFPWPSRDGWFGDGARTLPRSFMTQRHSSTPWSKGSPPLVRGVPSPANLGTAAFRVFPEHHKTSPMARTARHCFTPQMSRLGAHLDRRGFLATVGITTVGAIAFISSPGAQALVESSASRNHPLYRVGMFRRRTIWTTPDATLEVLRRKAIRAHDGGRIFDRNAFEVVLGQTRGQEIGSGTVTMTNKAGTEVELFLSQIAPRRYSAIINRQAIPRSTS